MRRLLPVVCLAIAVVTAGCQRGPTPEQQAEIGSMQQEMAAVESELVEAQQAESEAEPGITYDLAAERIELLQNTQGLLRERIGIFEASTGIEGTATAGQPDLELADALAGMIAKQQDELDAAKLEASKDTEGLIGELGRMTVAYSELALATLKSRYRAARFGLPAPESDADAAAAGDETASDSEQASQAIAERVVSVELVDKRFDEGFLGEVDGFESLDLRYTASGLDKPARSIKGALVLTDLFDEPKFRIGWTIEKPLTPGEVYDETGYGFNYNPFMPEHGWVRNTDLADMKASFVVESILYTDGTRLDL